MALRLGALVESGPESESQSWTRGLTVDLRQDLPVEAVVDADLWSESAD